MNLAESDFGTDDALFRIERKIAQRADELARGHEVDRDHALAYWAQAEREVWGSTGVLVGVDQSERGVDR